MKEELFSYIQATLQVLAPHLNEKEKEQLVREVVTHNFPKCALAYLKEKTAESKKNSHKLDIKPAIKEYETSKSNCMPCNTGLNLNYTPTYPPTYGDIRYVTQGVSSALFSNGSEESNYIAV